MLTIKVVTEYCGSQQPDINGPIRPATHIFEAMSVYDDAGHIIIHGVPDANAGDGETGHVSVSYDSILYDQPWKQTMYVMNQKGATVSTFLIGSFGGDIGCTHKIAPNPWHQWTKLEPDQNQGDQAELASGATPR